MEANGSAGEYTSRPSTAVLSWLRLARVFQRIDQLSEEHLRPWGLSGAQFDLLVHVGGSEGITQQDVATALLVTKGNVCQLVDRMERDGLVRRVPYGRSNRLYLTDQGTTLFLKAVPAQEAAIDKSFSSLTREEQSHLVALLRKLDHSLSGDKQVSGDTT